jgi:threonine dehydratase
VRLYGCEPYNYPKYARFDHARTPTIADALIMEKPHEAVQRVIAEDRITIGLVTDAEIRTALRGLFDTQALVIEPSSATAVAFVQARADELEDPVCVVLTGENVAREDHARLMS